MSQQIWQVGKRPAVAGGPAAHHVDLLAQPHGPADGPIALAVGLQCSDPAAIRQVVARAFSTWMDAQRDAIRVTPEAQRAAALRGQLAELVRERAHQMALADRAEAERRQLETGKVVPDNLGQELARLQATESRSRQAAGELETQIRAITPLVRDARKGVEARARPAAASACRQRAVDLLQQAEALAGKPWPTDLDAIAVALLGSARAGNAADELLRHAIGDLLAELPK